VSRRALVLDYDGLIVDSERVLADCVIERVAHHGGSIGYADIGHLFGTTEADDEWAALLPTLCDGLTLDALEAHMAATLPAISDALEPLPGVREVLVSARSSGWATGVGTGSDRARVEPRLARNGLLDLLDVVVTRADVTRGKPSPDIFLEVARRLGVVPADCLVLEDSPHGCVAALAAGMEVVACPSVVTAHCSFPDGVRRVGSLLEVTLV